MGAEFVALSLPPLLIGILAAVTCALPGNFLLLRRQALIGDAISHVVLPGIVVAFLLTGTIATLPMLLGAAGAALLAVILIVAGLTVDATMYDWSGTLFLARKLADLIEWLAFWR